MQQEPAFITEHIQRVVDAAPPLTPEQRHRLRELLEPVAVQTHETTEPA